jgi:hypothetical protein
MPAKEFEAMKTFTELSSAKFTSAQACTGLLFAEFTSA